MNRLEAKTAELVKSRKKALVFFVMGGYPDISATKTIIKTLASSGADIIEVGVPFSDPIADGPTIQLSSDKALKNGADLSKILRMVSELRKERIDIPIVLMSYLNPLAAPGLKPTLARCRAAGVDGFIVPDSIPEGTGEFRKICAENGLSLIRLVSPNTPEKRLKLIDSLSSAFVYVVSLTGVTGKRRQFGPATIKFLLKVRANIRKPKFLGFGISGPEQVLSVKKYVDGVIVGSALIDIISAAKNRNAMLEKISSFSKQLRKALD